MRVSASSREPHLSRGCTRSFPSRFHPSEENLDLACGDNTAARAVHARVATSGRSASAVVESGRKRLSSGGSLLRPRAYPGDWVGRKGSVGGFHWFPVAGRLQMIKTNNPFRRGVRWKLRRMNVPGPSSRKGGAMPSLPAPVALVLEPRRWPAEGDLFRLVVPFEEGSDGRWSRRFG